MSERPDVIARLTDEHRELEALLERLDSDEPLPAAARHELFVRAARAVSAHAQAEEELIYPAVAGVAPDAARRVQDCLGQHEEIKELLAELRGMHIEQAGFGERVSALLLELRRHHEDEEDDVFAVLRATLPGPRLAELDADVAVRQRSARAFAEPEQPEHVHRRVPHLPPPA